MFRFYVAILRQLLTFQILHTALVLKSKCISVLLHFIVHTKLQLFENTASYPFMPYLPLVVSMFFCVVLFSSMNVSVVL
jgi:hypothetical protein